ncbi:MAG: Gfo/Idh/MocA family oxidoreductase, partial [Rhizobiales bacterium]|nr:Gfo/Idh/MocA family oxidoreductase [Hyphomicrobiales bacterium]
MKQILQNLSNGETHVVDIPAPQVRAEHVQIASTVSLISSGTERMLVDFGRGSLVSKARQQPDKVRQALEKIGTDGLAATLDAVRSKLDQPLALGYCNVGRVIKAGEGCNQFAPGDRVVSNGKHAEVVVSPKNLCAKVPNAVSDEAASFTVIGAIALQGVRLAQPNLGETVAVLGLGLVGLLTVQLLRANGCRVLGLDFDPDRLALARSFGAETFDLSATADPVQAALAFSQDRGMDAVLLTASTQSSDPVAQAAQMSRKRGRVVLVGVTGLELSRADFFEKELTFQVSCSYGPGRYDPAYEEKGQDYPVGFVRWTEQRNFEAVLDLMASGQIDVAPLVSHRYAIGEAANAYDVLVSGTPSLGILITYPDAHGTGPALNELLNRVVAFAEERSERNAAKGNTGFIGAGNYGGRVLISAFKEAGASLRTIASSSGVSAVHYGKKFKFRHATSDAAEILADGEIDTVCICSRHDSHKQYVVEALDARKSVFVEKPLCLTLAELDEIEAIHRHYPNAKLMVGYNRRFAPHVIMMKELMSAETAAKMVTITVNASPIQSSHWTQDPVVGGGRIIGEACHFIDLARHLIGAPISAHTAARLGSPGGAHPADNASITLQFEDGSLAVINYLANGHKSLPKERVEVFCGGKVLQLDNFRKLTGHGWKGLRSAKTWRQDKGQKN